VCVVVAAMPPVWSNPLSGPAQSYQSINQVELGDDFYTRSKKETTKALTHASVLLKRMSEQEFHSCDNAFFLHTRNGLILVVKQLTEFVEAVLHAFTKRVYDSEDRLRKPGFASFATLRNSTKLNVTQRVLNKHDYPGHICDEADARFVPVLLTNNGCSSCEGLLIDLMWNRDTTIRQTGEFPVGTNKKGVKSAYGDVNLSHTHPGCLYIHSVQAKFGLREHDKQLEAHKQAAIVRRDANKENQPPIMTRPIDSFFPTSKIPSQENSTLTQEQVEEKLQDELFPETLEILLKSETKEDLNSMISSLQSGTEVPHVSDETYKKLRSRRYNKTANENSRKRAAGEDVPICASAAPVKLTTSQRAVGGRRNCLGPNCPLNIQFFLNDGSGGGWCNTCAPANIRSSKECSHPGFNKGKVIDGKCVKHCDKTNPQYIALKKREAEAKRKKRAKAK